MNERRRFGQPLRRLDALAGVAWRAAPGLTIYCCALSLAAGVLGVIYPIGFRVIVNGALGHDRTMLLSGVLIVAGSFAASWTCRVVSAMAGSRLTDLANLALGDRIGELVNRAPYLEHYERPEYLAQIENLREQRRTLAGAPRQVLSLAQSAITAVAVIVLLASVYPPVLVVPLLAVLPGLADRRASRIQKQSDDDLADDRRLLGALFVLASTAAPASELRTFGITDAIRHRHAQIGDEVNRRSLAAARRAAAWESLGWAGYAAGFAAGVVILVLRAAHGHTSPGEVVEAISLIRRSQRQLGGATDTAGTFMTANITAGRLLWLENYAAQARLDISAHVPTRLTKGIVFDHVSFAYPGNQQPVLSEISLEFEAGSTVAIVGENGAGKTTIVKLLTGMYRATGGRISVDGIELSTIDPVEWRQVTTGAFQDYLRLNMTVGDGVGAGDLARINDLDAISRAVDSSDARTLVARLPAGLETLLGPYVGGRSLSGGEWQRLALARGLMPETPLLVVLDEPSASLDAPTEAALFRRYRAAAKQLGATNGTVTILVSHRFSTVHMADQIVVMEHGSVKEHGSHAELLDLNGLYAELFELQARGYRPSAKP